MVKTAIINYLQKNTEKPPSPVDNKQKTEFVSQKKAHRMKSFWFEVMLRINNFPLPKQRTS